MKLFLIITLITPLIFAAPAFHGKRTFTQPDGTVVKYRPSGDEYLHWNETDNGDILLYSKQNKRLEHATIKDGHLKASGVAFSNKVKSKEAAQLTKVSKDELRELHAEKRQRKLSKMKSRHKAH